MNEIIKHIFSRVIKTTNKYNEKKLYEPLYMLAKLIKQFVTDVMTSPFFI